MLKKSPSMKLNYIEKRHTSEVSGYISDHQIEILKQKVRQLPDKPITVWKKFNKFFGISRYRFLPAAQFEEAVKWLDAI